MKVKIITMLSYLLKCKKIQKILIQVFHKLAMEEHGFYQNLQYVIAEIQDLLKKKKQEDCLVNYQLKTPLTKIPLLSDHLFQ